MSRRLLKSTAVTGSMTLVSRFTGLARDIALAHVVGAGLMADVFFVAFRIPNFFRRISGEGAFSQAFVPVFSEFHERRGADQTRAFLDRMAGWFGGALLLATLLGVLAAPALVTIIAPFFLAQPDKFALTVDALRITFPYLMFISLVAMSAGILNAVGRFAVPAATPILLNLCLILAALYLVPVMENAALGLALGVLIAGVVQLGFQVPFLWRERVLPHPRLGRNEGVSRVAKLMLPAVFASSVTQINLLVNTALASNLPTGSISWLFYSDRIMEFPLGVFGIALATVLLPALSRLHARGASEQFAKVMDWSLRWVLLIVVPAALGLILLAGPIVATLYLHGVTTPDDVRMIARSLVAFSVGLMGFVLIKVLVPGFFARQDTRTPVRAAVIGVVVNLFLGVLLFTPLGHVGLAIALSAAAWAQAGALFYMLRERGIFQIQPGWQRLLRQVAVATAAMVAVLWFAVPAVNDWMNADIWQRILWLVGSVAAGAGVYFLVILAQGIRPKDLLLRRDEIE